MIGPEHIFPCLNMLGDFVSEEEEPVLYYSALSAFCKALEQSTTFIVNKLQDIGQIRPGWEYTTPQPLHHLRRDRKDQEPERHSAFIDDEPVPPCLDSFPGTLPQKTVLLRRRGQTQGGETEELPSSMDKLLELAFVFWGINAVCVRDAATGGRIRNLNIIKNGQVLELLTKDEDDEAQQSEAQLQFVALN